MLVKGQVIWGLKMLVGYRNTEVTSTLVILATHFRFSFFIEFIGMTWDNKIT